MDFIINTFDQLNWLAIIAATLATMPVGFVWYDLKMGFGKKWAKHVGLTVKDMNDTDGMAARFGTMLLTSFLTAIALAALVISLGITTALEGLLFGIVIGAVFRGGAHFIHNGFAKRSNELSFIDAGHDTVSIAVMALIVAIWR